MPRVSSQPAASGSRSAPVRVRSDESDRSATTTVGNVGVAKESRLAEVHSFQRLGRSILFDVGTLQCYQSTAAVHAVVAVLRSDPLHWRAVLGERVAEPALAAALSALSAAGVLHEAPVAARERRPALPRRAGIRHLELMVTHACNLRCRYCYGNDGHTGWEGAPHLYGAREAGMSWDTARRGVDFLFAASGRAREVSLVFFGGEPLLAFRLIRRVVAHVRERERETGKRVRFSLSTNGVGLTPAVVDFLVAEDIGCQVSIDGPPALHDRNRVLASGRGSYRQVMRGVERLLARRRGRVPARVTVARGEVDLVGTAAHLFALGFGSVHFEPVIGGGALALDAADLDAFEQQMEVLAETLVEHVRAGRVFDVTNLVRHVRQVHRVEQRLAHFCGAARTYLALGQDGAFYPCHRFVGMPAYRMGDLGSGFDDGMQRRVLALAVDDRPACRRCWARYLCGGGCWKHGVDVHGSLASPDLAVSCRLIKHQIECAMAVNAALKVDADGVTHECPDGGG